MAILSHTGCYQFISRQSPQQTSATSRGASGPVSVDSRGIRDKITLFVALDCRGDFFNISLGRNNVNALETFVIVASAFVVALNRPDKLAQGACVENFKRSLHANT